MDIFTTVLTRVVPVPIKPERLRVKALSKEPSTNKLTDDLDHLESHEQYVDLSKEHSEKKHAKQNKQEQHIDEFVDDSSSNECDDMATVITHKEEFIHPKKDQQKPDKDIHHLDLFV
jgi:3-isopropylmalate dehydratase small subunit